MSYIAHSLGEAERLLYRAHFPWFYHAGGWVALVIAGVVAVIVYINGMGPAAGLIALAGLAIFLVTLVPIWTTEIGVTNQRLIYKRGLFWRNTKELQLRAIEEVNLMQTLLGRIFNFGRLDLHGTGVGDIRLPLLADPVGLRKSVQDGMTAAAQQAAAAVATAAAKAVGPDGSRSAA